MGDFSETGRADQPLARINQALRTLSAGIDALVRANCEEELYRFAVHNLVDSGGYRQARITYARDGREKTLTRMASAGERACSATARPR